MVCTFESVIMHVCPSEEADLALLAGDGAQRCTDVLAFLPLSPQPPLEPADARGVSTMASSS